MNYTRIYKLKYDDTLTAEEQGQLNKALQSIGVYMSDDYEYSIVENTQGLQTITNNEKTYGITLNGIENGLTFEYRTDAKKCSKELRNCLGATLPMDTFNINIINEETTEERLMAIHGEHIVLVNEFEMEAYDYDFSDNAYILSEEVRMNSTLNVNYTHTELAFNIKWNSPKVARKDAIENRLVELPLHLMAKIQYLIEDALISIKADFPINDAIIDCQFESINYTQSECAPDIIQLVKDAKEEMRKEA